MRFEYLSLDDIYLQKARRSDPHYGTEEIGLKTCFYTLRGGNPVKCGSIRRV